MIRPGDVVKTKTGKTLWIVEEITPSSHQAGGAYARLTKREPNGEAPRYVNTSLPIASLVPAVIRDL